MLGDYGSSSITCVAAAIAGCYHFVIIVANVGRLYYFLFGGQLLLHASSSSNNLAIPSLSAIATPNHQ